MVIDRREKCQICGKAASFRISDGIVCGGCMPVEYVERPEYIRLRKIRQMQSYEPSYKRVYEDVQTNNNKSLQAFPKIHTGQEKYNLSDLINSEISTSDAIDVAVSFIFSSGLAHIYDSLYRHCSSGSLRVLTSAYTGSTESEAVVDLTALPNTEVKMELRPGFDRFHGKAWIFRRSKGRGTALLGSANISNTALTSGREWTLMISEKDSAQHYAAICQAFERLWRTPGMRRVSRENRHEIEMALATGREEGRYME